MTPKQFEKRLTKSYPANVTCWSQATDEVRDMSRYAREILELSDLHAADFRAMRTPAQWNTEGVASIVAFYRTMSVSQRESFLNRIEGLY